MPVSPGEKFGRYRIISQIGVGGMGEVYLAEDTALERKVAVKILGKESGEDEERLFRFSQEARAASALNHPNILTIFDISHERGTNYIVSEYVEGETLKKLMKRGRPPLAKSLDIIIQTATALSAAHHAGIVHRDIKPANVMIRADGIVKVVDFGIAKLLQSGVGTDVDREAPTRAQIGTEPGVMIGTPRYMSPEQARGKPVDQRSDIFSLGLLMYELFSGKRPFEGDSSMDLISSILKDEPPPITSFVPDLPAELQRIVQKSMRKERRQRYQDIRDLLIDLEDVRDDLKAESRSGTATEATVQQAIHLTDADVTGATGKLTSQIVQTRRFSILHVLAIVGALVILAGGFLWYESLSHEADNFSKDFKISEIASWSSAPGEISSSAKFSPDAKLIAFSSTRSGTKDIWVTQTNSKEAIQITKDDASNTWPIWSPDGSEIAYFSDRSTASNESGNSTGVWRISALGGTPKIVGPITSGSSELRRWTKSGNIVYAVGNTLYSMSAADGKSKKLLEIGPGEGTVQWVDISDDEKTAAFVTQKDGKWQIREIPVSGGESIEVTERDSPISDVAWQSDKGTYFFTSAENGIGQIFGIVKGSSKASQITNSATGNSVADVSSDGKSLIFSSSREDSNLWRTNTASGAEAPVVQGISSELWPSVSPDGKTIAFQSISNLDRGDKLLGGSISVAKVADPGGKQEPVAVSDSGFLPAWSPDGKWIAFRKLGEKTEKLLKVSPDGGGVKELASGLWPIGYSVSPYNRVQVSYFDWKPDGSEIAYIASENGAFNVTSVSSEGGAPRAVTKFGADGESLACPIYSPDGKSIAFYSQWRKPSKATDKDRSLWTVGAESGEAQKLYETDKVIRLLGWTEDGKGLIFAEASAFKSLPPETVIRKVSLDGGASSEIAVLENAYFYNIFLSADGSRLGYAARENNLDDIWMVPSSGGSGRKLTGNNDSETYFSSLAWAHDGSAIYFGKQTRYSLLSLITNLTE